jgi:lipoprotein-anchoring transpeptidase ErfK/SrfK
MRRTAIVIPVAIVALLVGGAVGVYAYDAARDDLIADGLSVAGVDLGGMRASEARAKVERELAGRLERPIVVRVGRRRFTLPPERSGIRTDTEAIVQEALRRSRDGNVLSRTVRGITGGRVDADLQPRVSYSAGAVAGLVRRVKRRVDRSPSDATVTPTRTGLTTVESKDGVAVRGRELRRSIESEIVEPTADGVVEARTKVTKPKVTTAELADRYPTYIIVDRATFTLRLYKRLKLEKSYRIAVGAAGYDTPAGVYNIQNKAVNPVWQVPNREWAGELAGRQIPPGPENPIKARWLGIYDGAGIHGTDATGSIGSRASHGCVRMLIPDVVELYDKVEVGAPVFIGG